MNERVEEFKKRIETEKEFCEELYRYATIRLLAFKYSYYVLSEELVKDATYDNEEKGWYFMGLALGVLKEEDTSPCIDFDYKHPLANEGIKLAESLIR